MVFPGPALQEGAVDDQLGRGAQILHRWNTVVQAGGDQGRVGGGPGRRWPARRSRPRRAAPGAGCASGRSGSGEHTGTAPAPSPRTPAGGRKREWPRTGPQPRCGRFSCYYPSWRFASWLSWLSHQNSLKSKPPPYLTTHPPLTPLNTPTNKPHGVNVDCWVFFGQCLFCASGCLRRLSA